LGETLGLAPFPFPFAFLTAQALRAFSVRAAAAHSARRADEDFRRLAFGLAAGTDTPTAGSDAAAARDGSALAASESTIALESTAARNSRQSRTAGGRWARSTKRYLRFVLEMPAAKGSTGGLARPLSVAVLQC
jgi:hypothetical protein